MHQDEEAIRSLVDGFVHAIRSRDLRGVMSLFAPDVVSFDLAPPLQHGGGEEFEKRWRALFDAHPGPIDYEVRDLNVVARDDVAFSYSLNRNGDRWLRWTACYRKTNGEWRIVHEQVSVPIDLKSGRAVVDLTP